VDVIAIDAGGTLIKAARCGPAGLGPVLRRPTPADALAGVCAVAAELAGAEPVGAAAVVTPGLVDSSTGVVRYAANLGWRDVALRAAVEQALGVPVAIGHDVAAAATAEAAATGADDLLLVGIGTGIAAAHVVDGEVRGGATGSAGELGHTVVQPDGDRCTCGRRGCVEAYASATGIARRYSAVTGVAVDAAEIAARTGDPVALQVWAEATAALGEALATATLLVDPGVIVLGGGLAAAGERLLTPVRAVLSAALVFRPPPPVRLAALGPDAGLHGAAALARRILDTKGASA
jgi:glucokinase